MNTTPFSVSEPKYSTEFSSCISSIHPRLITFLGCIIDGCISDRNLVDELEKKLLTGLDIIDFATSPNSKNSMAFALL